MRNARQPRFAPPLRPRRRRPWRGATREATELRTAANAEGHSAGLELARAEFRGLLSTLVAEVDRYRREALPSTRALAIRMAERIVGRAVELAPDVMLEIVERAVLAVGAKTASGTVVVRVHPLDLERLGSAKETLGSRVKPGTLLKIVADARWSEAVVWSTRSPGGFDGRLRTQLAILADAAFGDPGVSQKHAAETGNP